MVYTKNQNSEHLNCFKTQKNKKRKRKKRNYTLNGGGKNQEQKQELQVISNSGIPEEDRTMSNQCFWISLLQGLGLFESYKKDEYTVKK